MRLSQKGFSGIILLLILGSAVLVIFLVLKNATDYLGKTELRYQNLIKAEETFKTIVTNFHSSEACRNTFLSSSETSDIKDAHNNKPHTLDGEAKVTLCFEDKNECDCRYQKEDPRDSSYCRPRGDLSKKEDYFLFKEPIDVGSKRVNWNAALSIEVYLEGNQGTVKRVVPVFVEKERGALLRCSTSLPAISSSKCDPMTIQKVCCRYRYVIAIPEGYNEQLAEGHDKHHEFLSSDIQETKSFKDEPPYFTYEIIRTADDDLLNLDEEEIKKDAQTQCGEPGLGVNTQFNCIGSSWDYNIDCGI